MKILIADDSIVSRHLLDATLRKWGYEVVLASDGNEAWEILQGKVDPLCAAPGGRDADREHKGKEDFRFGIRGCR